MQRAGQVQVEPPTFTLHPLCIAFMAQLSQCCVRPPLSAAPALQCTHLTQHGSALLQTPALHGPGEAGATANTSPQDQSVALGAVWLLPEGLLLSLRTRGAGSLVSS